MVKIEKFIPTAITGMMSISCIWFSGDRMVLREDGMLLQATCWVYGELNQYSEELSVQPLFGHDSNFTICIINDPMQAMTSINKDILDNGLLLVHHFLLLLIFDT